MEKTHESGETVRLLIDRAQRGNLEALGALLERFRPFLLQVAFDELGTDLRVKEAPSDLVQKSFMEAAQGFARFHGHTSEVLQAWLRQILLNNVRDLRESFSTGKRQLTRERHDLSEALVAELAIVATPPTEHLVRQEQSLALEAALAMLGTKARQMISLRHREDRSFEQIAAELNITEDAARKRWTRAIEELRRLTRDESSSAEHR